MKILWRLFKMYKPYWSWVVLGILLSLITVMANITLMAVSGWFIASMAIAGVAGASINYFSPAAVIRAMAILRTGGRYTERLVTHEATFRLLSTLRVSFYQRLEPLVPAGLEDLQSGDILSRILADINTLENFYIRVIVPMSVAALATLIITWVVSAYSSTLALTLLLMLAMAGVLLPLLIGKLGVKPGRQNVERNTQLRTQVIDGVQGLAELTLCGALQQQAVQVRDASERLIQTQTDMGRVSGLAQSGLTLLSNTALWLVMILAIPLVSSQAIEPAELAMLGLLSLAAFEAVMPLPEAFRLLGQIHTAAARLFELSDRPVPVQQPQQAARTPSRFDLSIRDLNFRYREKGQLVLENFNLDLPMGHKVAIVGESGAGKSSLIQLLLRNRQAETGQISFGGRRLEDYHSDQLHDWIAVVPQQVHLFNTTIRQNLLLAKPQATEAELHRACVIAQLDDFIAQQPEGYETWVGETGVKLSGGQARRIAIARALLRDFQLLILDEPGEGLDSRTEMNMIEALLPALDGRSMLLITHNRSVLRLMDETLFM